MRECPGPFRDTIQTPSPRRGSIWSLFSRKPLFQQPRQKDPLAWQEIRERCSFGFCDLLLIAAQFKMCLDGGICNDTK